MPVYGYTFFLGDDAGSYGWTETYFSEETNKAAALTQGSVLLASRTTVLTDLHKIVAVRVSDTSVFNDSKFLAGVPVNGAIVGTVPTIADPWSCLLIREEADWEHRGRKYLHGILKDTFEADRSYDATNPNNGDWQAFFAVLRGASMRLKTGPVGSEVFFPISDVIPLREVSHRVGRPFGLLVGRRTIPA
jgi:hypothetical protein